METSSSLLAFAALSQDTRLNVFRLLVRHEPGGMPAGEIARHLSVPHNTLSSHLGILNRAGLVVAERRSRQIVYRADLQRVAGIVRFLLADCCGGAPEICGQLVAEFSPCCTQLKDPADA